MYQGTIDAVEEGDLIAKFLKRKLDTFKGEGEPGFYTRMLEEVKEELYDREMCWINLWKLADLLSMPALANLPMHLLITEFDPKKLKSHRGFDFLLLVDACYAPGTSSTTPIRIWILALFATGMAQIRRKGLRFQDAYRVVSKEFLLDVQWYRKEYEDMGDDIKKAESALDVFEKAGVWTKMMLGEV